RLFSPIQVGPLTLAQRTWVPAMVPWRASETGFVTPEVLEWYECFARGRPGAIVIEATGIRDVPSGPLLRAGHDRFLPGLRDLPAQLPMLFARAARRAREAGFDGIELHFAHAYTMASFLSRSNTRADGYGGTLTNRVRLPLEVYSRVRAEVGQDFAVGCRFL